MTTTDPTAGPQIVSGDYDEAAAHHDALVRQVEDLRQQLVAARQETARVRSQLAEARADLDWLRQAMATTLARLRSQLAEARQERDQAAEALAAAETERDEAHAEIACLERDAHEQGTALWIVEDRLDWLRERVRLAMDLLCSPTVPHEKGPDVPGAYGILSHVLAATAPETAPESPHTADPAPARVEASTEHLGDADGAVAYWHTEISEILAAWLTEEQRTGWQRLASDVAEQIISDLDIADMAAELDQLRAEWSALRGQVGRAIVLCGPRGDKPIDVIVASVIDDLEEARQENADLRAQLAEARQQRDQATEALAAAETERDAAREIIDDLRAVLALSPGQSLTKAVTQLRDDLAWLRRQVLAVAEDLERYASDLRWEGLERKLAWTLRHVLAATAPETAPESPQTDEQAQVRGESHTEPAGTVDDALHRIALHRIADHLDIPPWISPAETAWRVIAEIDRLRDERDALRAVYEPLLAQVTDWHTRLRAMWLPAAMGAVADLREEMGAALGTTPDTGGQP